MASTIQTTVRLDKDYLVRLEAIGQSIKPKPLNRSEMLNVAMREYVERRAKNMSSKTPARSTSK